MKLLSSFVGAFTLYNNAEGTFSSAQREQMFKNKQAYWTSLEKKGMLPFRVPSIRNNPQKCVDGAVVLNGEVYDCNNIDFESFVSLEEVNITDFGGTTRGTDIWGWVSPEGKEIAVWTLDNGARFVDVTDAANPLVLGYMPSGRGRSGWADTKVYENAAYVVKDVAEGESGIQVFDLLRLANLEQDVDRIFEPDFDYVGVEGEEHGDSHNLVVDYDRGILHSVGTDSCLAGLHMMDIKTNPLEPKFLGCARDDGYTHDAQCVTYYGPDKRFTDEEICFAFNEDTLTIWNVTDPTSPNIVSRTYYEDTGYTHQGWTVDSLEYIVLNDELDEQQYFNYTQTKVFDIKSLTRPKYVTTFVHPEQSIDHNLYLWGSMHKRGWAGPKVENHPNVNYAYLSNYLAGIKVLDFTNPEAPVEIGKFDVSPDRTEPEFSGTWSNYMFPSGKLVVSTIDRGLFVLTPQMAFDPEPTAAPTGSQPEPELPGLSSLEYATVAMVVVALLLVFALISLLSKRGVTNSATKDLDREVEVAAKQVSA